MSGALNKYLKEFIIIIITVLLLCVLLWTFLFRKEGEKAFVYKNDELLFSLSLTDQKLIEIENTHIVLELDGKGNIKFKSSDCPDKLCIKKGKISKQGDFAACIPNGILIQIQ
ncbi:MAG: hypothetical protein E7480_04820 [Ruminococcaceae bacterium]|nr:hypothetical protein [Oscillospiraceae bacterium]